MKALRTILVSIFLVAIAIPFSFAQNADTGSAVIDDLVGKAGMRILSKEESGGRLSYVLSSAEFANIVFDASRTIDRISVQGALRLVDALTGWKSLKPASLTLTADRDDVRLRVLPSSFAWEGKNLVPVVPSGLTFVAVGTNVSYDFRMKTGSYFLRMQGRFAGELALLQRMVVAIADPEAFVRESDPEYAIRRVVEFEEELAAALESVAVLENRSTALEARSKALEGQSEALASRSAALEIRSGSSETEIDKLQDRSSALEGRSSALEGRSSALETRSSALEARSLALETRSAALETRSGVLEARAEALEVRSAALEERSAILEGRSTAVESRSTELEGRSAALEARSTELEARALALETRLAETEAKLSTETASSDRTLAVAAALMSKGLFGAAKPVPPEIFAGVKRLRSATPAIAAKEIVLAFKSEGVVATEKQVKAVLALLYGEF